MFNHTVTEARRLGMNIDLTPSGGWRLGGPHVTKEHSERSFAVKDGKIEVGSATSGSSAPAPAARACASIRILRRR